MPLLAEHLLLVVLQMFHQLCTLVLVYETLDALHHALPEVVCGVLSVLELLGFLGPFRGEGPLVADLLDQPVLLLDQFERIDCEVLLAAEKTGLYLFLIVFPDAFHNLGEFLDFFVD